MHYRYDTIRTLSATVLITALCVAPAIRSFALEYPVRAQDTPVRTQDTPAPVQTAPTKVVIAQPPTAPGETTETTVTTTTKPDGTTTTVVTTKTYKADSTDDGANDGFRMLQPDEKGLKFRFATSLGTYNAFDKAGTTQAGLASKLDYFFYRTTRHEALFSSSSSVTSTNFSQGLSASYFEYRWRFGDAGHAYTGVNLGIGLTTGLGSGNSGGVSGAAIGYEYPSKTFVEFRYTALSTDRIGIHQFLIGSRF